MDKADKDKSNRKTILTFFLSICLIDVLFSIAFADLRHTPPALSFIMAAMFWVWFLGLPAYLGYLVVRYFENRK